MICYPGIEVFWNKDDYPVGQVSEVTSDENGDQWAIVRFGQELVKVNTLELGPLWRRPC